MKKFKNKNTGEIVLQYNDTHYQDTSSALVHKRFILNSCEWEEVVEKEYEILALSYFSDSTPFTIYSETKDGAAYSTKENTGHVLLRYVGSERAYEKNVKIHSVKRLSDGEIFTVGDKATDSIKYGTVDTIKELRITNDGKNIYVSTENNSWGQHIGNIERVKPLYTTYDGVERFKEEEEYWVIDNKYAYKCGMCKKNIELVLKKPHIYRVFSTEEKALEYAESVKPKPLFRTEDNIDVFEGDTYWCVNTAPHLWSLFEQTAKERTQLNKGVKAFSKKELAEKFKLLHQPLLSLEDLISVWGGKDYPYKDVFRECVLFKNFKELVKSKQ